MRDEFAVLGAIPAPSEQSKSDMKYSTQFNRLFLTPIGIWPTRSDAHIIEKFFSQFLVLLSCFLIFFLLIPCSLHTFIKEQDPKLKMKMIGPLSFCLMSITKYLFSVARKREISHCLEHIDTDWRRVRYIDDREIMLTNAKLGRFIACLCAVFMYGGGFFYHTIMPFAAGNFVTPDNITIRPLTYAVYDPLFSAQTTPAYEIVFTIQWLSGFVNYSVTIGACSLAAVFVLHICGQLKIVSSRLESFVKGRTDERRNLQSRLAEIIELHLRALGFEYFINSEGQSESIRNFSRFIIRVERILNEICLIEFIGCTMNICFLGYYFMTEFEQSATIATVTYCVLLVSFTFNIFIFCYIGEMLTQQGYEVGRTAYMIKWYELPAESARGLILLLAMTKNPMSITAGKMAELSFRSFCGVRCVLKTAAAYLNLLRTERLIPLLHPLPQQKQPFDSLYYGYNDLLQRQSQITNVVIIDSAQFSRPILFIGRKKTSSPGTHLIVQLYLQSVTSGRFPTVHQHPFCAVAMIIAPFQIPQCLSDITTPSMTSSAFSLVFEPTDRSKCDFAFSTQITRLISTPIGLWPLDLPANIFKRFIFEFLVVIASYSLICFFIVACGMHAFFVETNIHLRLKILGPLSFCFMAISKYSFFLVRRDQIRDCLNHIDIDWRRFDDFDDREIMLTTARIGRFVGTLSACFMYGGGIFYRTILPLSIGTRVTPDNITIRPLICKVYEPLFGGQLSPSYELCFTGQWFAGFVVYTVTISTCSFASVFVLHACGQLEIVMARLRGLVDGKERIKTTVDQRIAEVVVIHLRALRFIFRIESVLNEICLVEIVGCTWNICFLSYCLLTDVSDHMGIISVITMCLLFTSFTFNIFIFCYIGDMLTQQGRKIGTTVWMIDWYRLPNERARDLILLLAMSNYPTGLTAGKMIDLSYTSFCSVFKTAAAYFNFIRTMII
ncbi:uncharacterized protein LOC135173015 [Diachasmimorpha longicaudata]|uniref:uncharacterized protein LOC135173015 n=1 Tax=Diachasmimorpha longicaudata TaxID=58733 RepID=UPI0030B88CFC